MSVNTGMLADSTKRVWVCVCASVWGFSGARWAVSWPEPQPDFINQGRKRVQPLKLGLKTLLAVFLWCLFLHLNALSLLGFIFLISLSKLPMSTLLSLCLCLAFSADKFCLWEDQQQRRDFKTIPLQAGTLKGGNDLQHYTCGDPRTPASPWFICFIFSLHGHRWIDVWYCFP